MRRKLLPWLWDRGPLEKLAEWLQGYDLPPVGDEITPSQWLLDALGPADEELRTVLAEQVGKAIQKSRWDVEPPGGRKEEFVRNLLALIEGLRKPAILGDAIWHVLQRRAYLPIEGSTEPVPGHPLVRAVMYNQPDGRFHDFWRSAFLAERQLKAMPEYVSEGLLGFSYVGLPPNVFGIVEGANTAKNWSYNLRIIVDILAQAFNRVWAEYPDKPGIAEDSLLLAQAIESGWSEPIVVAWRRSEPNVLARSCSLPLVSQVMRTNSVLTNPFIRKVLKLEARSSYRMAA
jgi:hypothetical protein